MTAAFTIRAVQDVVDDTRLLAAFFQELAAYDNFETHITPEKLHHNLFHEGTHIRAFFACLNTTPIGFITCYECLTVYHGQRGLYIPGAFITAAHRGKGYGRKLFQFAADYARKNNFAYMNWLMDDNNTRARAFYEKMGAKIMSGYSYVRINPEQLT